MKIQLLFILLLIIQVTFINWKSNKNQNIDNYKILDGDSIDWKNQHECSLNLHKYKVDNEKWEPLKLYFFRNRENNLIYYLTCEMNEGPVFHQLQYEIDLDSYEDFGYFAIDKDSVYYRFLMSDGFKIVKLEGADRPTFETFGKTMYAKDKNNIYYSRHGRIENADLLTFKPLDFKSSNPKPPLAMDKNNIYIWDEVLYDTTRIDGLKEYLESKK